MNSLFVLVLGQHILGQRQREDLKKVTKSSLFEPREAEKTCVIDTSDHRSAANNAPLEELLRSRREQLRQTKFATSSKRRCR